MFLDSDIKRKLQTALAELDRMTPGTEEYVNQSLVVKNLTEAYVLVKD